MKSPRPFAVLFQGTRKWFFFGILAIIVVGSVVYYPASGIGLWTDDYWHLEMAWPTTRWQLNEQVPDGIVIPIPKDAPAGNNYRLEVGLYYLPTLERLLILDAQGQPITDKVVIGPISIVE